MCLNNKEYFAWFNKSRDLIIIKDNGVKLEHLFRVIYLALENCKFSKIDLTVHLFKVTDVTDVSRM